MGLMLTLPYRPPPLPHPDHHSEQHLPSTWQFPTEWKGAYGKMVQAPRVPVSVQAWPKSPHQKLYRKLLCRGYCTPTGQGYGNVGCPAPTHTSNTQANSSAPALGLDMSPGPQSPSMMDRHDFSHGLKNLFCLSEARSPTFWFLCLHHSSSLVLALLCLLGV